jgi:hypothetical protein
MFSLNRFQSFKIEIEKGKCYCENNFLIIHHSNFQSSINNSLINTPVHFIYINRIIKEELCKQEVL